MYDLKYLSDLQFFLSKNRRNFKKNISKKIKKAETLPKMVMNNVFYLRLHGAQALKDCFD